LVVRRAEDGDRHRARRSRRDALAAASVRSHRGRQAASVPPPLPPGARAGVAACVYAAHRGVPEARLVVREAVAKAAVIAHPGVVHGVVAPRQHALDLVLVDAELDVAAVRAARADALVLLEEPHATLVVEVARQQRADRTDVCGVDRVVVVERAFRRGADVRASPMPNTRSSSVLLISW
jgi:hypothetical protein